MNVRQRQPRERDESFLAYVRTLPCTICSALGCDPAHIRSPSLEHGKDQTGTGRRPSDRWCVPLCRHHHDEQHARGDELAWWASYGIDPFVVAIELYASRPGADKPRRERGKRATKRKPRKPKGERRSMPKGPPLKSANRLPGKGQMKFPRRSREGLT